MIDRFSAPYPPFPLIEERPRTTGEARERLQRMLGTVDARIAGLLGYFELERRETAEETLRFVCEPASVAVKDPQFSRPSRGPQQVELRAGTVTVDVGPELTPAGRALAADLGLLIARALLEYAPNRLRWDVVSRPPRHVSLHQPVLQGFGANVPLEPYRVSRVCALKVLDGTSDARCWSKVLEVWKRKVIGESPGTEAPSR